MEIKAKDIKKFIKSIKGSNMIRNPEFRFEVDYFIPTLNENDKIYYLPYDIKVNNKETNLFTTYEAIVERKPYIFKVWFCGLQCKISMINSYDNRLLHEQDLSEEWTNYCVEHVSDTKSVIERLVSGIQDINQDISLLKVEIDKYISRIKRLEDRTGKTILGKKIDATGLAIVKTKSESIIRKFIKGKKTPTTDKNRSENLSTVSGVINTDGTFTINVNMSDEEIAKMIAMARKVLTEENKNYSDDIG